MNTPPPPPGTPGWPPQQPGQQPPGANYETWWFDGRKWRPPVPQLTRWQLIGQMPGMLLKLTFLIIFLVIIVVAIF